jgi:hypothetical protein
MIEPIFPLVPSIIAASVALVVLIFLETKRKQKFLVLRIIAQTLLVGSVLLLTLRPSLKSTTQTSSLLLLTDGSRQSTIDSLRSLKPVSLKSYNELTDLNGLSVITGNGLPSWALDLLPSKNYSFVPSPSPKGVTAIEFDEHIYAHRWNEIRGTYNGIEGLVKLRGPGGLDDSVKISNGPFSLSFFTKAPGRFNYDIITNEGTETLPLVIEPERNFNIIFLSTYPTFEMRYLKNFLASKRHRLSIRNQVSRGVYKFEFANRPASNFQSLTQALLNDTDLVILDEHSWHSLSAAEQKVIKTSIDNGLGILLLPESDKLQLITFKKNQQKDTVRVSLGRVGSLRLPALSLESKQSEPLLKSIDNRVVSGYVYAGKGKIGYQLLGETYQAGLQGKSEAYSALWVPLLEKVARTLPTDLKLKITSPFPYYENEPVSFDIISSGKEPKLKIDNIGFPLTEDVFIDDLWHGTTWLDGNKWHDFSLDSATTAVHIATSGTWKSVSAANNRRATALQAGQQTNNEVASLSKDESKIKILLFVIFMLSAGFLWLAPKL